MADALIWGASGGIGQALTKRLVQSGWRVFAVARDQTKIPDGVYGRYSFDAADVASIKDIAIDLAHQTEGISLSVYAAGDLHANLLKKMPHEEWQAVVDANLTGAFLSVSHTLQLMPKDSHIIFIGAYIDHLILPKMGAYAVAKAGLETLVDILQKENRHHHFSIVRPGAVNTSFWQNAPFRMPQDAKDPEFVATAILNHYAQGQRGSLNL